jgi:hypothetical protein
MDLPGGYLLSYTFTAKTLATCPAPMQMLYNQYIANAQLSPASCEGPDGRRSDYYAFNVPAAATQAVVMTSDSVSPDLALYKADGSPLRTDQDSYADDNAIIVQYLAAGNYLVRARSADPTVDGLYNLYFLPAPGAPPQLCAPLTLTASGTVNGQTSFTSCVWYDKTFADIYQVNVSTATQVLTITAQSNDVGFPDTYVILMDSKGNIIGADDNSGGGLNAQLVETLDPGSYFVVVKPAYDPTSVGKYVLSSVATPAPVSSERRKN